MTNRAPVLSLALLALESALFDHHVIQVVDPVGIPHDRRRPAARVADLSGDALDAALRAPCPSAIGGAEGDEAAHREANAAVLQERQLGQPASRRDLG